MAMFWTEVPIAMAFVAMRIYSRLKLHNTGYDDWMMVITLVGSPPTDSKTVRLLTASQILFIPTAIAATFWIYHGGGRHLYYLAPEQRVYVIKVGWVVQPFNIMAQATGKASVALLILRLLGPLSFWRRWFLYVSTVLTLVFGVLTCIFTFVQCDPARTLWEGPARHPDAKCWNPKSQLDFSIFDASELEISEQISSARFLWLIL